MMKKAVKDILIKKYGYDLHSDWFTDEIKTFMDEVSAATEESLNTQLDKFKERNLILTYSDKFKGWDNDKLIQELSDKDEKLKEAVDCIETIADKYDIYTHVKSSEFNTWKICNDFLKTLNQK